MGLLAALILVCAPALAAEPVIRPASNTDPSTSLRAGPDGKVGERPYEMVWANRKPAHPEVVDFEDLTGWTAVGFSGCTAELVRSREEQMYGTFTGKAVYTGQTSASSFELRPPQPIPIPGEPTAAQLWVRGNNWGWHPKPKTARTSIHAVVRDAKGEHFNINLGYVNFDYWSLLHATLISPTGQLTGRIRVAQAPSPVPAQPGAAVPQGPRGDGKIDYPLSFVALRITGCSDEKPAKLSFDSLQFYKPDYQPLSEPKLPPKDAPWPTTPDTITPTPTEPVLISQALDGPPLIFTSKGERDTIRWVYVPKTGTLSDLTVEINGKRFQPCADGGPVLLLGGKEYGPADDGIARKLTAIDKTEHIVLWRAEAGGEAASYSYHFRAKDKSLQVSVTVEEPRATAFRVGHAAGTPDAELISVPYMSFGNVGPHVVHWDGVFLSGLLDWYNSDASTFFEEHGKPKHDQVVYNGGSRYLPKTDGTRNPLRERLILTVSSDFQEVLPNIPHPQNPMAHLATGSIWRNVGEPVPDLLKRLKAGGVERFICPLHEVGWRDAGESFTFRLRCAPRIGDEKMKQYGDWVKSLGYRFGLYANYTDYAPVNGNWQEDRVCLDGDGNWRGAWPRCYAPKPTWAWQAEADLAPKIAQKFGAVTCYSDVHTAITPWDRTDYDARTPGAAMFRTTWACYARILWNECQAYGGPVFSEGRMHWMSAGLISGNYAQITGPERWKQPPLVDFDLLKMHPLECDFGMGLPDMFYSGDAWRRDRSRTSPYLDRFITSTLAFGHIGFLPLEWGFDGALKGFYMTNAVQQRYALVPVEAIRYFDGEKLLPTSEAIRTGAYRRGQVNVRYKSGLELWCNLSFEHDWTVACEGKTYSLPPTGHLAFKKGDILQFSAIVDGQRMDYVDSPDYVYLDTRGTFAAIGPLACCGAAALKPATSRGFRKPSTALGPGPREVKELSAIPCDKCEDLSIRPGPLGLGQDAALAAEALDLEGNSLGEAEVRVSDLGQTLFPVKGAARYRVSVAGTTVAPMPGKRIRRLVVGLDYTVGVGIANVGRGTLKGLLVSVECTGAGGRVLSTLTPPLSRREREGGDSLSPGERDRVRVSSGGDLPVSIRAGREGLTELTLRVPDDAKPGERLWYRVRIVGGATKPRPGLCGRCHHGRTPVYEAEGIGWFTGIAAAPVEAELAPASALPQPPGSRQELLLKLRSNLPGRAAVAVEADAPSLGLAPSVASLDLDEGVEGQLKLSYALPQAPAVAPVDITLTAAPAASKATLRRWLLATRATAVALELAALAPSALGMGLRGKPEEPLRADSGAQFHAASRPVGGVEKPGFFCHPPYQGGVGYAVAEFPVALPDEPCAFEAAVGFTDGSSTADGCVFSVEVREPPAGSQPAGGYKRVAEVQFGELKKCTALRADLSAFRGRKIVLRLVTDVGPKDDSSSDWAFWAEPRIVLSGDRLLPTILEKEPAPPIGPPQPLR